MNTIANNITEGPKPNANILYNTIKPIFSKKKTYHLIDEYILHCVIITAITNYIHKEINYHYIFKEKIE